MTRDEAELRAYLGARFDRARLVGWQEQLEAEAAAIGDEARLYRESEAYLYNLTAFAMTGTKDAYRDVVASLAPAGGRLLDVGCGIGSDGLDLLERGFAVTFADFDNPSTRYLRWRLQRRGLAADVVDLDAAPLPGGFDVAYAFDVLEHVEDPFALLRAMEGSARVVCVNALETSPDETALHRELPVEAIVAWARSRGLLRYDRLHGGRSHLLAWSAGPAPGVLGRAVSGWRAWRGARGGRPRGPRRRARRASAAGGGAARGG
jgi:SAM-dependent methyltransferase